MAKARKLIEAVAYIRTSSAANVGADKDSADRRGAQPEALIMSRVQWTHPINVDDFKFLEANSDLIPKITIPGPCALHFRGGE